MILTKETMNEIDNFFNLFENYVDDVSLVNTLTWRI